MTRTALASSRLLLALVAFFALSTSPALQADDAITRDEFSRLDQDVQKMLGKLMARRDAARPGARESARYLRKLNAVSLDGKPLQGLDLFHGIKPLLLGNPGHRDASALIAALFRHNQGWLIAQIRDEAEAMGEIGLLALIDLHQAAHLGGQGQWDKVSALVQPNLDELGDNDLHYAHLLLGAAQQQHKRHRAAVKHYREVPPKSRHYLTAQINLATAYIRQGWISEVRELIGSFNKANANRLTESEAQRLILILGYALLTREYFQDATRSFNSIPADSIYHDRALLGTALALISQQRFSAALPSIRQLQASRSKDLPAQEAHLLLPLVYQKSGATQKAANAFTDAIDYYQGQINKLKKVAKQPPAAAQIHIDPQQQALDIDELSISYADVIPQSFMLNLSLLRAVANADGIGAQGAKAAELLTTHEQILRRSLPRLVQRQLKPLRSYLSQSRYGLARFYDK